MFPALREAWAEMKANWRYMPEPLELKANLDLVNAEWYSHNGYQNLYAAWNGGAPSWSGERVSVDSAQTHSVVWACKRIISESIAFMPLFMMQKTAKGKFAVENLPLAQGLHNAPNDEMTTMEFRETLTGHCVMQGNAYAKILRRSGSGVAQELYPLQPSQVIKIDRDAQKRLVYHVKEGNSAEQTFTIEHNKPHDLLHIRGLSSDGIKGYSVVEVARNSMGTAAATEKFAATFYAGGGRVPYVLEMQQKFRSDEDFKKFRADWEETYSQPHKAPIMEPGMTYKQIGLSVADSQFLQTRQFNIPEICRWFLVSPHLVGDLSRATFSNIEQLALEFVKMTLMAWITRWEQSMWRCLLTPDEKSKGYYFKHNVNGLLRGDFASRMMGYASALQNGHLNIDEVRDLEDRNPLPDGAGENYHIQLNQSEVTKLDAAPTAPNIVKLGPKQAAA